MEGSDHRFYVRHLYENFKLGFKGQQLKIQLWEAARAYTEADFQQHLRKMKELNVEAHDWLTKVPVHLWSRSAFIDTSKNNILINNICESWNAVILEARDKPIIYMLEWIRRHLMLRFQYIQKAFNKVKQQASMCKVHYVGDDKYEVQCYGISKAVNLDRHTCSCKVWNLTGITCRHAVACIFTKRDTLESYVHPFYYRETYMKCYGGMILPIPMGMLMKIDSIDTLLPPHYRKPTSRPKKARNKKNDDPKGSTKLSKSKESLKCSECKENGHNSRTCKIPKPLVIDRPPPRRSGRPPSVGRGRARGPNGMSVRVRERRGGRGRARGVDIQAPITNQEVNDGK
ncbi:uncharacterized protein LOC132313796 [Cornus florida]|uniref:uncharacterized protein LOC132313796 n=1 Tax=Cornus florida TaxID=4283 RepID=UPI0028A22C16|nr:uncharacterized protein LOC132313796 [Cornus florida]